MAGGDREGGGAHLPSIDRYLWGSYCKNVRSSQNTCRTHYSCQKPYTHDKAYLEFLGSYTETVMTSSHEFSSVRRPGWGGSKRTER